MVNGFRAPIQPKPGTARKQSLRPAVDAAAVQQQWLSTFAQLDDPRGRQGIEHAFLSIVMIAVFATLGGATGWDEIELYAESHETWLATFLYHFRKFSLQIKP